MIRKFEFKNNFLSESLDELMATFCSIGYFDGMETKLIEEKDAAASLSAPMETHTIPNGDDEYGIYEKCDYFSIVGLRKDSSLDEEFWSSDQEAPFVFVTCLRLKSRSEYLENIMETLEKIQDLCCYSTLDSSDMLIAMRRGSYIEGCAIIERMYPVIIAACDSGNAIQKSFTTVSVKQEILNDLEHLGKNMVNDIVCCKLNCVFNNWKNVDVFLSALRSATAQTVTQKNAAGKTVTVKIVSDKTEWERYGVLGTNDIAIMTSHIAVRDLFGLYSNEKDIKPGNQEAEIRGLLHHGCKAYKDAFVNITTELLVTDRQMTEYMQQGLSAELEEILADLQDGGKTEIESVADSRQKTECTDSSKPEGGCTDAG